MLSSHVSEFHGSFVVETSGAIERKEKHIKEEKKATWKNKNKQSGIAICFSLDNIVSFSFCYTNYNLIVSLLQLAPQHVEDTGTSSSQHKG